MKESDVVIPEETTEVKLAMRVAELEAENKYLKLEAKEDEELIVKLENKLVTKVRHCDVTNRIAQLESERDKLERRNEILGKSADERAIAIQELEAERDRETEAWQLTNTFLNEKREQVKQLESERDRLLKHVELLEEDVRCYQADL